MNITLGPDAQKMVDERMKRGGYATPEQVVLAGLASLEREEHFGDFATGEWDRLLDEAEQGGESLDGEVVFAELRGLGREDRGEAK